jgi:Aromatic prenyltransferase Orf2
MSEVADVQRVYSAIEESARLLGISCSRDKFRPVLTTYQHVLADAMIVFSMASGRRAGELDISISMPAAYGDPYTIALANGLLTEPDHPIGTLHGEIQERFPIGMYGIDGTVNGGFKKIYTFLPKDDLPGLDQLADIPSMPRSVADNAGLFSRYGMDKVQMISFDYHHRTLNLYFGDLPAECLEANSVRSMVREMGLPEPAERELAFARRAFSMYPTVSWHSSKVERICIAAITTDPETVPAAVEPQMAQFAKSSPYAYADDRALVYGLTFLPGEKCYKLGAYYQISDHQRKLLKTFDALEDQAS